MAEDLLVVDRLAYQGFLNNMRALPKSGKESVKNAVRTLGGGRRILGWASGSLDAPGDIAAWIATSDFSDLPIEVEHAIAAAELPRHHTDPFDRMLIAQAQLEELTLVAHDDEIAKYDVSILDASA